MNKQELKSNGILTLAAMIWGFAFVAQRVGGQLVPCFFFNAIRFALGCVSLLPLIFYYENKRKKAAVHEEDPKSPPAPSWRKALPCGLLAGLVLFTAASLQQYGLYDTTAGKAGFITDLYIFLVPLVGLLLGHRVRLLTWASVALAVVGLYFISVNENFSVARGDLFELGGALFWTFHILLIDRFSKSNDVLKLSLVQFVVCSALSFTVGGLFEQLTLHNVLLAAVPILYGGICSVGVAYTLQIIGQKHARPSHSAIILSLESVFSCVGGALILGENLGGRAYFGCALMVAGMVLSSLNGIDFRGRRQKASESPAQQES